MFLLSKSSGSVSQYNVVLVLLCLLLLPSQLLAVTCDNCGFNYDQEDFNSCPRWNCYQPSRPAAPARTVTYNESGFNYDQKDFTSCPKQTRNPQNNDEDEPPQRDTTPSQSAVSVNPDSNSGTQKDESPGNLEFSTNVFRYVASNIDENFVMSPDSLFQTLALLLLYAGADGATEQCRQNYLKGDHSEPSGAAVPGATACGHDTHCVANSLLAASQPEPLSIYKERLEQIHDDARDNINLMKLTPMHSLAQELNGLFCQLTQGMVQRFCNPIACPLSTPIELITSIYFRGLLRMSRGTESAALFTLPNGQASVLDRIMDGKMNPSRYANHDNWEAFTFPDQGDHEIILVLSPPESMLYTVSPKIITALFSSLDSDESSSSSSTITPGPPHSVMDTNTEMSEALSRSGSGLISAVNSDLNSGAMPAIPLPVRTNVFRQHSATEIHEQGSRDAALPHAGCKRSYEGATIQSIRFDQPFIYILRNKITKRILFIGQILASRDSDAR